MRSRRSAQPEPDWPARYFDERYLVTNAGALAAQDASAQARDAAALAGVGPGARVLDAPCGFGRHAVELARLGARVDALDASPAQLAEAARRCDALPADVPRPRLRHGDVRALPYADGAFGAVLNLFTSLGYRTVADDARTLAEAARVLAPGGRLVVETTHLERLRTALVRETREPLDGGVMRRRRRLEGAVVHQHDVLVRADGTREERRARCRVYTAPELVGLLRAAGFDRPALHGDLDGRPFDGRARRLVAVATRR